MAMGLSPLAARESILNSPPVMVPQLSMLFLQTTTALQTPLAFVKYFNSSSSGKITARAEMDINLVVDGQSISLFRETDGAIGNSTNGVKTYVDADISVIQANGEQEAVKEVGNAQEFIITLTEDGGDWLGPVPAVGETVDVVLSAAYGAVVSSFNSTCDQTDINGQCSVSFTSEYPGTISLSASSNVEIGGIIVSTQAVEATATFVDATLTISPDAAQEVNKPYTLTISLEENNGDGLGYLAAAGETVILTLTHENGDSITPDTSTCDSTDVNGTCTLSFTSSTPGKVTLNAESYINVQGIGVYRASSAVVTFVDARVELVPSSSIQGVNQGITFEVVIYLDDGTPTPIGNIPISVEFPDTYPDVYDNTNCLIPDPLDPTTLITGTDSNGTCSIFLNHGSPDDIPVVVTVNVEYAGLTLFRVGEGLYRFVAGKIAPTNTTCLDYVSGTAEDLNEVFYGVQDGLIGSASPGVFFYFTEITAPAPKFNFSVKQTETPTEPSFPLFEIQKLNQVWLYEADCSLSAVQSDVTSPESGQVDISVLGAKKGTRYILLVKYSTANIVGQPEPQVTYNFNFSTWFGDQLVDFDQNGILLLPR